MKRIEKKEPGTWIAENLHMQEQPLVSIIIPTYNRAHLIGETLDSIITQNYQNWECIVVDDGSTDHTAQFMKTYCEKDPRIQYYHRPEEHLPGGNGARNYGFKLSKGEYIQWFDSDDLMHQDKLKIQMGLLKKSNKLYCICQTLVFKGDLEIIGLRKKSIHSEDPFNDYIQGKIFWLTQAPIISKDFLIKESLFFNEKIFKGQEYDFFIRLLAENDDYVYTNIPLVYLRKHSNQISNRFTFQRKKVLSIFNISEMILEQKYSILSAKSVEKLRAKQYKEIIYCIDHRQYKLANVLLKKMLSKLDNSLLRLKILFFFKIYEKFKFGKISFIVTSKYFIN